MKIQLVKNKEDAISGYQPILYSSSLMLNNLQSVSDNQGEVILASNILDDFAAKSHKDVILSLVKKLRMNGSLVVGGTDIRIFCKSVVNSTITESDASDIIGSRQSMSNLQNTIEILKSFGLKIQSTHITGMHYEVTAVRN